MQLNKPDFICIGLPKTGTTWLFAHLNQFPEVWIPPPKEFYFFWGLGKNHESGGAKYHKIVPKTIQKNKRRYLARRWRFYKSKGFRVPIDTYQFDLKFLLYPRNPKWYESLFKPDKIGGDLTTVLYWLGDEEIKRISEHLPRLKVMINLRDPVDRLWSNTKMLADFVNREDINDWSDEKIIRRIDWNFAKCPSFVELIEKWKRHFPEKQILVNYFDLLEDDPVAYLERICDFLGIDFEGYPDSLDKLNSKLNPTLEIEPKSHYSRYIAERYLPAIEELCDYTSEQYPVVWKERAEAILQSA